MGRRSESACACTGPALLGALLVALLTVTACWPGRERGRPRTGPRRGPCRPGRAVQAGGSSGARWRVDWVTVDGRNIDAPPDAGAWVEFGYDNTAVGDYRMHAVQVVGHGHRHFGSTVGTDTSGATPDDACPAKERAFEQRMRKIFTGGPWRWPSGSTSSR